MSRRWLVAGAVGAACASDGPKDIEVPPEIVVDIVAPVDGQLVQYAAQEAVAEAVFVEEPDPSTTWTQWTSEPPSAVGGADCTVELDGTLLRSVCPVDTTAPVEWLAFDVGTGDGVELASGGAVLLVVWRDNDVPEVLFEAPAAEAEVGADVVVELTLADEDSAETLDVAWSSDVDGALVATAVEQTADGRYVGTLTPSPGRHTLTVAVTDGWGVAGMAERAVVVVE